MTFRTVLVANRGEIALRVIRACRSLGLRSIVVHSAADAGAAYLALADEALCIGPGPAAASYLDPGLILLAANATGAEAIHPGYGFLSENAGFAEAVERAGLVFIGPTAPVIRMMGDKIEAKAAMRRSGVPCVPGSEGALPEDHAACAAIAEATGYPLIVKAAGGGGGRGMRVVREPAALREAIKMTREEARRAFGNPELYLEKFLEHPRHIEIQVLCDQHGAALWLGERDCSLQRRHQKVVEEAPAPGLPRAEIAALGERCAAACRAIGYRGAGTFEFLYEDGLFAFIEMNTRIQVEHPVTEAITGIDILREQIRVAMGERLAFDQDDIAIQGHALECRINAEDAFSGLPSPGRVTEWHAPGGPGIRVDSHMAPGSEVPPHYDSLIAKVIAHGKDREESLRRMSTALNEIRIEGVATNIGLHRLILDDPDFRRGKTTIHHLERRLAHRLTTEEGA
ncbi:acetyl-CoA carboxylase biotin carboxylase subunit [Roseomonas sp. KE0001]|uniref:acetyl-CoA carboxylase biotin carboxylase subunit n=1 Tax=Roseomonas sp. KE0001 TaxID=2479201 RepID=UPI0018DFA025|nr:acetyl-CoA carboxylase biotin carboxylase subunit [Roseomonas sp. KE0001]MBI0434953.1 acetyl-CoA carboxylase biotin carboxylase subunit [Roseomonas sp. KE0001]